MPAEFFIGDTFIHLVFLVQTKVKSLYFEIIPVTHQFILSPYIISRTERDRGKYNQSQQHCTVVMENHGKKEEKYRHNQFEDVMVG
jgi:hypothetical protein